MNIDTRLSHALGLDEGRQDKATLDAFMASYWELTVPHLFAPYLRLWSYANRDPDTGELKQLPLVHTEISPFDGYIHLAAIGTELAGRRQGQASWVMGKLTELADKHQVTMTLSIDPYGHPRERKQRPGITALRAWYERHGFERDKRDYKGARDMVRHPKGAS